jgi:hypothetical protein
MAWRSHADPLPVDLTDDMLMRLRDFIQEQRRPATNAEVIAAVRRLRLHYSEWSQLSEAEEADVWRDWCLDFKAYPKALLDQACGIWRNSSAKKPPTSGQLKDKVSDELKRLGWAEWIMSRATQAANDPERRWRGA